MLSYEQIAADLRAIVADCLGVEEADVVPSANFFIDLGGESIDVLDLMFRCEKRYGVPVRFQEIVQPTGLTSVGNGGPLSPADREALKARTPFLDWDAFESLSAAPTAYELFTVDTIIRMVQHAIATLGGQQAA